MLKLDTFGGTPKNKNWRFEKASLDWGLLQSPPDFYPIVAAGRVNSTRTSLLVLHIIHLARKGKSEQPSFFCMRVSL